MGEGMIGFPKPQPRIVDKHQARRDAEKAASEFRLAVQKRDGMKCRVCGRKVIRTLELRPERSEVHHLRGRNVAPEDRYNVDQAIQTCAMCHAKLTARTITWTP